MTTIRRLLRNLLRPDVLLATAFLVCLIGFGYRYLEPLLYRTWFWSSDEYVYAAEVMRFSKWDFRQHGFDNPATPFMLLDTVAWAMVFAGKQILGGVSAGTGIGSFTLQQMPLLFAVMRGTTLFFYLLSPVFLFWLCARVSNKPTAAIASLLLVLSPIYSLYSSFVRSESMAMVLILGALLLLSYGLERSGDDFDEPPGWRDYATAAGFLAGIAAGARMHSLTAALPVLAITLWVNQPVRRADDYPAWVLRWSHYAVPLLWAAALALLMFLRATATAYPAAIHLFNSAVGGGLALTVAAVVLYRMAATRAWVVRILSPAHLRFVVGLAAGGVLGNFTVFAQRKYFFDSIQMYSGYLDRDRMKWPLMDNFFWYIGHYLEIISPDRVSVARIFDSPPHSMSPNLQLGLDRLPLILLALGAVAILAARDRKMLPALAVSALFFVSMPLNVRAGPHHVILWLPFFFMVCGYPVGLGCRWLSARLPYGKAWAGAALAGMLLWCAVLLPAGPVLTAAWASRADARLHNIERATAWVKANAGPKDTIAISYFCFNSDVFWAWMDYLNVPVPPEAFDGREYLIWWGQGSALKSRVGYACATRRDVASIKTKVDLATPGEGTDPYSDARFQRVASFGEVDLFRFDYR